MDTTSTLPAKKKTGRPAKGYARANILIQPEYLEWAKYLDGGLSQLVRRLLREEYERQRRSS